MRKLRELARREFLERAEHPLAFGLPGVGKSHFACAIANALDPVALLESIRAAQKQLLTFSNYDSHAAGIPDQPEYLAAFATA